MGIFSGLLGGGSSKPTVTMTPAFNASSGMFNTAWNPDGFPDPNAAAPLSYEQWAAQNPTPQTGGVSQSQRILGDNSEQLSRGAYNSYLQSQSASGGSAGLNMGMSGATQALQQLGLSGANQMFGQAMNNPNATTAGLLGNSFMQSLQGFNPMDVAQQQYGLLSPQLLEQQNQDFLNLEGRQFSQGRLGSTGGALDMQGLFQGQNNARNQLMADSYGQGLQGQAQLAQMAQGFSQLDPSLRGMFGDVGNNLLGGALGIEQAGQNQAAVAGTIGQPIVSGGGKKSPSPFGAGLLGAGLDLGVSYLSGGLIPPGTVSGVQGTHHF